VRKYAAGAVAAYRFMLDVQSSPENKNWLLVAVQFCASHLQCLIKLIRYTLQFRNKREGELRREKRDVAEMLTKATDEPGQLDRANIRVESVIRKERELEAHGIIKLMCELLFERAVLIKESRKDECPDDLRESTDTLIWAASRSQIKELKTVVD